MDTSPPRSSSKTTKRRCGQSPVSRFEAYMGALIGRPRGSIDDVYEATRGLEVVSITDETASTAVRLQEDLRNEGVRLPHIDVVLAGTTKEQGTALATNDTTLRKDAIRDFDDIVGYRR